MLESEITESSFADFVSLCDVDPPASWKECSGWLLEAGLCDFAPGSESELVVRESWLGPLDDALSPLIDAATMRTWLERASGPTARRGLLAGIEQWARRGARWDVLNALWDAISEKAGDMTDTALAGFIDVPVEARKDYPALTWASAMAETGLVERSGDRAEVFLGRLLLDSSLLHADWALRDDTDEAVTAGTVRMIGERWLPSSGSPLDAAWRTKRAIDTLIDERSRRGQPPGRFAHSFFRAVSALLALLKADLRGAVEEARWATILGEGPPVTRVAQAVEILAHSFAGEVELDLDDVDAGLPTDFRFGGLSQMAAVMVAIARGRRALVELDRRRVAASLRSVSPDVAAIFGLWAPWAALRAFESGLWGDPAEGLNTLLDAVSRQPIAGGEQDEPTGAIVLAHAREFL